MAETIVQVRDLTRRYGRHTALDRIDIELRQGQVYGLVGANGAGKTTLIKHLLGLLRAQQGSVRVFGLDPVAVLQRIGYLSEERAFKTRSLRLPYFAAPFCLWLIYIASVVTVTRELLAQYPTTVPLALLSPSIALLLVPLASFAVAPLAFAAHRHR